MTQFLLRTFAKNPADRSAVGAMAGKTGIVCNCLLFVLKLLAGLAAGSVAMVADGFNNLSDAASSAVTLLGFRLARIPADREHPYGHGRYEYLAAMAVSVLILLVGVELAKSSLQKLLHPQPINASWLAAGILAVSIALKFWMAGFYRSLGNRIQSPVLLAAAADSRNDVIATGAVLAGLGIYVCTQWNLDGLLGLGVSAFILCSGVASLKDTVSPLLGTRADNDLVEELTQLVLSHGVLGVHDLLIHDYGPGQRFASLHAEVDADANPLCIHDLLEDIEEDALQLLQVHLVIHSDPVVKNDPEQAALTELVARCAGEIDSRITVHDLHLAHHEGELRLVFDLAVPYDLPDCASRLEEMLHTRGVDYEMVIHVDGAE